MVDDGTWRRKGTADLRASMQESISISIRTDRLLQHPIYKEFLINSTEEGRVGYLPWLG